MVKSLVTTVGLRRLILTEEAWLVTVGLIPRPRIGPSGLHEPFTITWPHQKLTHGTT